MLAYFGAGFFLAWKIPASIKLAHVREQNALLDRCRSLLVLGLAALEARDTNAALKVLQKIRQIESRWHYGASTVFRLAKMLEAVFWAALVVVLARLLFAILWFAASRDGDALMHWDDDLFFAIAISLTIPIHAMIGYFETWTDPWKIDNCGDRLEQTIHSPRGVEIRDDEPEPIGNFDGLGAREVMGIGPIFTLAELNIARRQLVKQYHPDRWRDKGESLYRAAEEALKRVNAAYDELKPLAD